MIYIKRIILRLKYSINKFLYRFRSNRNIEFIYEHNDEDSSR
jgi:hypothetical protein